VVEELRPGSFELVVHRIRMSERALNLKGGRLWELIQITPERWRCSQYPDVAHCWVVGIIGHQCLYLNEVEDGFNWGHFSSWGEVDSYGWEQDEVHDALNRLADALDS